jgi:mannosyl-3-phosphoglycerate phosphatase
MTKERQVGRRAPGRFAVFTDVDGCVLDAHTYRPGPSRATLRLLARQGVPVVFSTSKTRAEVRSLYASLGVRLPAIIESGAAILLPPGTLRPIAGRRSRSRAPRLSQVSRGTRDGDLVVLGPSIARVRAGLAEIGRIMSGEVWGFGEMTARDIAKLTGLDRAAAERARQREFDEPFVFTADPWRHRPAIRRVLARRRLVITRGGRFHHLHGRTDKGRAMRLVRRWLAESHDHRFLTVALGDSEHDLPLLRAADVAVIVPRPDGRLDPALADNLPAALRARHPGPAGWSAAVRQIVLDRRAVGQ